MRFPLLFLLFLVPSVALGQEVNEVTPNPVVVDLGLDNPEIEVLWPAQNGWYTGFFVVQTRNVSYRPELATNPVEALLWELM